MRRRALLGTASTALAALAGCSVLGEEHTRDDSLTRGVPDDATVAVDNLNGDVTVESATGADLVAEYTVRSRASRAAVDDTTVDATVADGTVTVETTYGPDARGHSPSVDLTVRVPDGATLNRAATGNGRVTATGVAGDATLDAGNGRVEATDVDGYVALASGNGRLSATGVAGLDGASTGNGDIDVEAPAVRGDVTVESGNGDVTVRLGSGLDVAVVATTGNGDVSVEGVSLDGLETGGGRVRGRLGDGTHELGVETGNGDVAVRGL